MEETVSGEVEILLWRIRAIRRQKLKEGYKVKRVLNRLKVQYKSYEKERNSEDEETMVDVALACDLADSVPYLISKVEQYEKALRDISDCNGILTIYDAVNRADEALKN